MRSPNHSPQNTIAKQSPQNTIAKQSQKMRSPNHSHPKHDRPITHYKKRDRQTIHTKITNAIVQSTNTQNTIAQPLKPKRDRLLTFTTRDRHSQKINSCNAIAQSLPKNEII